MVACAGNSVECSGLDSPQNARVSAVAAAILSGPRKFRSDNFCAPSFAVHDRDSLATGSFSMMEKCTPVSPICKFIAMRSLQRQNATRVRCVSFARLIED